MRFDPDSYISVSERIEKFYAKFPQGRILTSIVEHSAETGFVLIKAEVYREPDDAMPAATGHAYELKSAGHVQAGSYVEVCETSAVGRALALLGFEVRRGVTSREEAARGTQKAQVAPTQIKTAPGTPPVRPVVEDESDEAHAAIDGQVMALRDLLEKSDEDLTASARAKFKDHFLENWDELDMAGKRWLLGFLEKKAPKAVA